MVRNILILVLVCLVVYFGYYEYKKHQEVARLDSGDYTCQGCDSPEAHARFLKENSGETPDGDSEHKPTSARVAAEEAAAGTAPTGSASSGTSSMEPPAQGYAMGSGNVSNQPPMNTSNQPPVVVPTTEPRNAMPAGIPPSMPAGLPTRDTETPNAPNGMRFAGSGNYQWYRQGNLTWRVDTTTGRSCIIYATMEEWRKQVVMSHGCGRDA